MKTFVEPVIEIEKFEMLDVIATSDLTLPGWELGEEDF